MWGGGDIVSRMTRRTLSLAGLVALLGASGITHLVKPEPYVRIVPRWVPGAEAAVFWSGIAEIALAAALAHPRTRRAGGWGAVALFVAVFPANVQHAVDAEYGTTEWWLTQARLPFQPLLIWWAWTFVRKPKPCKLVDRTPVRRRPR